MFRPLEAIFRLHKIDLEEKEHNIYSKIINASQSTIRRFESLNAYYIYCIPSLPDLFCVI